MLIPDWLVERANDGVFPLNVTDLGNDFNEILQGRDPASIVDDDSRNHCCELLRARQRDIEYLSSLDLHKVIAKHVRARCRMAQAAEETVESWVNLDSEQIRLIELADDIENAIRAAWKVRTTSGRGESKFTDELSLDNIDKFHYGLENQIGYPPTHSDFLSSMQREHDQAPFDSKRNRTVDPRIEWNIVMQSDKWNFSGVDCKPTIEITSRACTEPLKYYVKEAMQIFEKAHAIDDVLNEAEVAALRLWTGPMHEQYAEALRNPQKPNGPYVTTLHAINSGITKLARIWPLPVSRKVYRGYKDFRLQGLKKDAFNCVGGVERCVLATSEDFNVAVDYSEDGAFILEIEVGQASRGADVSWVSQFPHEREILFNALSNVEFVCSPQQRIVYFKDKVTGNRTPGKLLVYKVRVSANLRSKTLEEFISLRKHLHLNMVDVLAQEALRTISMRTAKISHGLIKRLRKECTKQCDAIRNEATSADVRIFNEGTEEYARLVKDVIMFKSRSETIIDLASRWFEHRKADPAEVAGLLGWQLQALRDAFKECERPQVTTVILEQERHVDSLFSAMSLKLGAVHEVDTVRNVAKLLSLNPELESLEMVVASAKLWENVFNELCPGRPSLRVNGFHLAQYDINTLQRLDLRHSDSQMAAMIGPALLIHPPSALTCLNLCGTPIACAGAKSLGRAFTGLQRLKYLDLRSCGIADGGCTGIAQTLSALVELEHLTLAHNNVDYDGFNILASTIRAHGFSRLQSLDVRFNKTLSPSLLCGDRCVMSNHVFSRLRAGVKVHCVAWSPGADQIAGGSDDGIIKIWNAKTGEQVLTLQGPSYPVTSVAWRSGGDLIASGSHDKTIIIWDGTSGQQVSTPLTGHTDWISSVAWRPGANQIASGSWDNAVIIWDAVTGEQVSALKGHRSWVRGVAWNPDGTHIASASNDTTIIIWDAMTEGTHSKLKGHKAAVMSVAWDPRGDQIVSGSSDKTIIIWDAKSGKQVSRLSSKDNLTCVAWHPECAHIASGTDEEIIIWDAKTGEQVSQLKGHIERVSSVAWRPGGDQLASASEDTTITIWDAGVGEQVSTLKGHNSAIMSVAWRPGGDQFVSGGFGAGGYGSPGHVIIWGITTEDKILELKGHTDAVTSVAWCPEGDHIASASEDTTIIIWDAQTGDKHLTLQGHTKEVRSVAWRPGGDQIASGSGDNTIIIWSAKTGEQLSMLKGHTSFVTSVAWCPGHPLWGDRIASASYDKTVIVWDAHKQDQISILEGHTKEVTCVAWIPKGDKIASGSIDSTVIIWDVKTCAQESKLKGHTSTVTSVAWCPRGNQIDDETSSFCFPFVSRNGCPGKGRPVCDHIASASLDRTVIVWDATTGEQISILKGHTKEVMSVAWGSGGDKIVSGGFGSDDESGEVIISTLIGSLDGTITGWEDCTQTGEQVLTLMGYSDSVISVARSPWSVVTNDFVQSTDRRDCLAREGFDDDSYEIPGISCTTPPTSPKLERLTSVTVDKFERPSWEDRFRVLQGDHTDEVTSVTWRPGSDEIASGSWDNTIIIWDAKTGDQVSTLHEHSGPVTSVAWSPGGDLIASASVDKTIIIWDAKTGAHVLTLKGHTGTVTGVAWRPHTNLIQSLSWRPGDDQIASCSWDNTVIVWDAKTGEQGWTLKGHTGPVESVAWCPGGDQIASPSWDKTIIIWDAKTGEQVSTLKGHTDRVTSVAWRPGGDQIVSGGWGGGHWCFPGEIIIWDAKTGNKVSRLKGHIAAVTSVALRPGGDQIVSGAGSYGNPGEVIIWDANTGDKIAELKGHTKMVTSVAWRPGGDQIATGSHDRTIMIWDVKTSEARFDDHGLL